MNNGFNLPNKAKRIICPECKGEKRVLYYNETEYLNEEQPCGTCEGEGIVISVTTIKSLRDAGKN